MMTEAPTPTLSSRLSRPAAEPERTRISCYAALTNARMKFANATKFNRKSGVAEWRDLRFLCPSDSAAPNKSALSPLSS
jgi:hypothetical protein